MSSKFYRSLEDFQEVDQEIPASPRFSPLKSALRIAKNGLIPAGKFEVFQFFDSETKFWFYLMDFLGTYLFAYYDGEKNFGDLAKVLEDFTKNSKLLPSLKRAAVVILWGDAEMIQKLKPLLLENYDFLGSTDSQCFDCLNIIPENAKLSKKPLEKSYYLDSLKDEDADFVASKWQYSAVDEPERIRLRLRDLPSVCIRSSIDHQLAGWVMVDHRGMVQHLHVLPLFRGQGLRAILMERIGEKVNESLLGIRPFYCVDEKNDIMIKWIPENQKVFNSDGQQQKIIFTAIHGKTRE